MPADGAPRPDLRPALALVAVQLCFGAFPVFGKIALAEVSPLVLAALRAAAGVAVLGLLARERLRREAPLTLREHAELLGLALLGIVGNQVLFISGLHRSTATNAALISATIPVFTLALAALFRVDAPSPRRLVGIPLALSGALLLMNLGAVRLSDRTLVGDVMLVVNCLSYAAFLVGSRGLLRRRDALAVTAWLFRYGAVPIFVLAAPDLLAFRPAAVSAGAWGAVAGILAFPTVAAYSLNIWALARTGPSTAAVFVYLQPLVASALAWTVLGERPGPRTGLAALLIFAGLALATLPGRPGHSSGTGRPSR
ncbi:MAG TPA: DMT family transporter [Thermoanaerobaculia bacterium]|nr:DMT family transporter [Thermoanaerobaculia bacterium]